MKSLHTMYYLQLGEVLAQREERYDVLLSENRTDSRCGQLSESHRRLDCARGGQWDDLSAARLSRRRAGGVRRYRHAGNDVPHRNTVTRNFYIRYLLRPKLPNG